MLDQNFWLGCVAFVLFYFFMMSFQLNYFFKEGKSLVFFFFICIVFAILFSTVFIIFYDVFTTTPAKEGLIKKESFYLITISILEILLLFVLPYFYCFYYSKLYSRKEIRKSNHDLNMSFSSTSTILLQNRSNGSNFGKLRNSFQISKSMKLRLYYFTFIGLIITLNILYTYLVDYIYYKTDTGFSTITPPAIAENSMIKTDIERYILFNFCIIMIIGKIVAFTYFPFGMAKYVAKLLNIGNNSITQEQDITKPISKDGINDKVCNNHRHKRSTSLYKTKFRRSRFLNKLKGKQATKNSKIATMKQADNTIPIRSLFKIEEKNGENLNIPNDSEECNLLLNEENYQAQLDSTLVSDLNDNDKSSLSTFSFHIKKDIRNRGKEFEFDIENKDVTNKSHNKTFLNSVRIFTPIRSSKIQKKSMESASNETSCVLVAEKHKDDYVKNRASDIQNPYNKALLNILNYIKYFLGIAYSLACLFLLLSIIETKMSIIHSKIYHNICGEDCGYLTFRNERFYSLETLLKYLKHKAQNRFLKLDFLFFFFILWFRIQTVYEALSVKGVSILTISFFKIERNISKRKIILVVWTILFVGIVIIFDVNYLLPDYLRFNGLPERCDYTLVDEPDCGISYMGLLLMKLSMNFHILGFYDMFATIVFIVGGIYWSLVLIVSPLCKKLNYSSIAKGGNNRLKI